MHWRSIRLLQTFLVLGRGSIEIAIEKLRLAAITGQTDRHFRVRCSRLLEMAKWVVRRQRPSLQPPCCLHIRRGRRTGAWREVVRTCARTPPLSYYVRCEEAKPILREKLPGRWHDIKKTSHPPASTAHGTHCGLSLHREAF